MNEKSIFKAFARAFVVPLLVISILFSVVGCGCSDVLEAEPLTKNEIAERVASDRTERESVVRHIYEWGFPQFNTNKFYYVESLVEMNFYEKLPSDLTVATTLADLFLEYFYDNIPLNDSTAVTDAILKCYMASIGDPYAEYRVASEHEAFMGDVSGGGSFVGVGVLLNKTKEGYPYVITVYKDSGAMAAGMLSGDVILSVDDKNSITDGYDVTVDALRGEAGTKATVTVLRNGEEIILEVERRELSEATVTYFVNEETGYAYVSITSFKMSEGGKKNGTADEFKAAIDEIEKKNVRGIVFDLRNNLGGEVGAVVETVSYLVEDGLPVLSYKKGNEYITKRTVVDAHSLNIPTVVLVNEFTASAAEIFAAALRDYRDNSDFATANKNVTIVGKNTYGKGVSQSTYLLADGSSVMFTSSYYNPPSGVNYHGVGIAPDEGYEVEYDMDLSGDAQIKRAYEALDVYFKDLAA